MIIHSRRREEKQVAVSGLDKTSKCREEAVQAALANNTAPLYDTALAHTGREQVQRHALAGMGRWHHWLEKQIIPPVSYPEAYRHNNRCPKGAP